jgi:hypothetical protein
MYIFFYNFKSTYVTYKLKNMYNYHSVACYKLLIVYID